MPKATLTFALPEEREEFELAQNASKFNSVLFDLDNFLRNKVKYGSENIEVYEEVRNHLWELLSDRELTLK